MTTDATKGNAEQWHAAPCQFCGPNFLGTCPHRPLNRELTTSYVAPGPAPCVNMDALIRYFEKELQRERDRVAVERTAASSAREALAACEERLRNEKAFRDREVLEEADNIGRWRAMHAKAEQERDSARGEAQHYMAELNECQGALERMTAKAEEWRLECLAGVARQARLADESSAARSAHESMTAHRDKVLAACDRHEQEAAELRSKLASVAVASLEPGSTAAVIEAYRMLVGDGLEWSKQVGWHDETECDDERLSEATLQLIHWLDVYAPGGRP